MVKIFASMQQIVAELAVKIINAWINGRFVAVSLLADDSLSLILKAIVDLNKIKLNYREKQFQLLHFRFKCFCIEKSHFRQTIC